LNKPLMMLCMFVPMLVFGVATFADDENVYIDPRYGFSISPPVFDRPSGKLVSVTPVLFAGAAIAGQAPSCNVQIQFIDLSIGQFMAVSEGQIAQMGTPVSDASEKEHKGHAAIEMLWKMQNMMVLSVAIKAKDRYFVLTCMAPNEVFYQYEDEFRRSIETFEVPAPNQSN